ncbi:MAG: hypothetical protein ACE5HB_10145 [Terriglobia bacterium]
MAEREYSVYLYATQVGLKGLGHGDASGLRRKSTISLGRLTEKQLDRLRQLLDCYGFTFTVRQSGGR